MLDGPFVMRGVLVPLVSLFAAACSNTLSPEDVRAGWHPGILAEHSDLRCFTYSEEDSFIGFRYEIPKSLGEEEALQRLRRQIEASLWAPGPGPRNTCYRVVEKGQTSLTLACHEAAPEAGIPWAWYVSVSESTVVVLSGSPAMIEGYPKQ